MFEIRFQGLMTHARVRESNGNEHQRVVLYYVANHKHLPLMTIRKMDRVNDAEDGDYNEDTVRCYNLRTKSGDQLTTVSTDLPSAVLPTLHLAGVPSLREISNGVDPQDAIANFKPTMELPVLVDLPDGALLVRNWFKDAADFGSGRPQCVPQTVVFTVKAAANVKITLDAGAGGKRELTMKPDSLIYITNLSTSPNAMPHHDVKKAFFKNSGSVTVQNPTKTGKCEFLGTVDDLHGTCSTGSTLSVECSNTNFP